MVTNSSVPSAAPDIAPGTGTIRAGVIGYGLSGRVFHAPFLAENPDFSLDVIVTGDPERRASALASYPQVEVLATVEELFDRDDLDLVVIGSPPASHVALAHAALDAGFGVVVDKPVAASAREGWELVERARSLGLPLTVFQNRRWDGDFLTLQSLLADGALGEVHTFESRFESFRPGPPRSWKAQATPAQGGGILFDLGAHLIDQAVQLFGPVDDVHAEVATRRAGGTADDDTFVSLRHGSGVRSHLWMSSFAAQVGPRFRVLGSTAAFVKWGLDGQEASIQAGRRPGEADFGLEPEENWGTLGVDGATRTVPTERGRYAGFYAELAHSMLTGAPVPVDAADAVRTIELIERIHAQRA